jgi:hypothetical protein
MTEHYGKELGIHAGALRARNWACTREHYGKELEHYGQGIGALRARNLEYAGSLLAVGSDCGCNNFSENKYTPPRREKLNLDGYHTKNLLFPNRVLFRPK